MIKWKCSSLDEYRALRKQHKQENVIGPKREKKVVETPVTSYSNKNTYKGKNNNYKGKK